MCRTNFNPVVVANLSLTAQPDTSIVSYTSSVAERIEEESRIPDFSLTIHRIRGARQISPCFFALVEVKPGPAKAGREFVTIKETRNQIALQARFAFDAYSHLKEVFIFTTCGESFALVKFERQFMIPLPVHRLSADSDSGDYSEEMLYSKVDWPKNAKPVLNANRTDYSGPFRSAMNKIMAHHLSR
jgi:hypothetical protein